MPFPEKKKSILAKPAIMLFFLNPVTYVTVPEKRVLVTQIMIFLRRFSATTPKNNSQDKNFCVCLPLFAYTHAKFERVEVFLKGQARCIKTAT